MYNEAEIQEKIAMSIKNRLKEAYIKSYGDWLTEMRYNDQHIPNCDLCFSNEYLSKPYWENGMVYTPTEEDLKTFKDYYKRWCDWEMIEEFIYLNPIQHYIKRYLNASINEINEMDDRYSEWKGRILKIRENYLKITKT